MSSRHLFLTATTAAVILFLCCWVGLSFGKTEDEVSSILDKLFQDYDKRLRPNYGKEPVRIELSAYILDLYTVDVQAHEFSVNMYFRHHWNDPRLTYKPPAGITYVSLNMENAKKLWIPDTFMVNERKILHHGVGNLQELTRIEPDGDITRSARLTITASCVMDLRWYPFDRHVCSLEIESYGHTANEFLYAWKLGQNSVGYSQEASSLKFDISGIYLRDLTVYLSNANYSRVAMDFLLSRRSTRDVQERFFPIFVFTSISFFTLFIGTLIFRTQISLGILATLLLFMGLTGEDMPKVTYQTALDSYLFASFLTILNVLIVNFLMQYFYKPVGRKPSRNVRLQRLENANHTGEDNMREVLFNDDDNEVLGEPQINNKFEEILHKICIKSKYIIPASYLIFNIIYWFVVLIASSGYPENFMITENRGD